MTKPTSHGMAATFQALKIWVSEAFSEAKIIAKEPKWIGEAEKAHIQTFYGTKYNYTITITREKR